MAVTEIPYRSEKFGDGLARCPTDETPLQAVVRSIARRKNWRVHQAILEQTTRDTMIVRCIFTSKAPVRTPGAAGLYQVRGEGYVYLPRKNDTAKG